MTQWLKMTQKSLMLGYEPTIFARKCSKWDLNPQLFQCKNEIFWLIFTHCVLQNVRQKLVCSILVTNGLLPSLSPFGKCELGKCWGKFPDEERLSLQWHHLCSRFFVAPRATVIVSWQEKSRWLPFAGHFFHPAHYTNDDQSTYSTFKIRAIFLSRARL